jgi:hypothetical protein
MANRTTSDGFMRLAYPEYSKLSAKAKESYNKKEREANFNKKMEKKYGNKSGSKKLNKFFSNLE